MNIKVSCRKDAVAAMVGFGYHEDEAEMLMGATAAERRKVDRTLPGYAGILGDGYAVILGIHTHDDPLVMVPGRRD